MGYIHVYIYINENLQTEQCAANKNDKSMNYFPLAENLCARG